MAALNSAHFGQLLVYAGPVSIRCSLLFLLARLARAPLRSPPHRGIGCGSQSLSTPPGVPEAYAAGPE